MYTYTAYRQGINMQIITLTKEGLGIRSTARVLRISTTTLLKRILLIAKTISRPAIHSGKGNHSLFSLKMKMLCATILTALSMFLCG